MSYVVQQPYSRTNPTSRYRVVEFSKWVKYSDGEISSLPVAASCDSMEEATTKRDSLNSEE